MHKRKKCAISYIITVLPDEDLNEHQRTDVVLNLEGVPFMTLTESKIPNTWYHDDLPYLFILTSRGFRAHGKGKEGLFKQGFGRE